MKTITFYKDNKIDGKYEMPVNLIIKEYLKTEKSKWDMPFDRKILNFMAENYGYFDILSDKEWDTIYREKQKQTI